MRYLSDIQKAKLKRFHEKWGTPEKFTEIVEKIEKKCRSFEYIEKRLKSGLCDTEGPLYDFLLDYSSVYGRKLTKEEERRFSNLFTEEIYIVHNYCIQLMKGVGTGVKIIKI